MRTSDFDYDLPPEYIAQTPIEPRDASRLLVLDRKSESIQHAVFREMGRYLKAGDLLVLNETRVIPARLFVRKVPGGGRAELLLLRRQDEHTWETMVGGKGLTAGKILQVDSGPLAEVIAVLDGPRRMVRFAEPIEPFLPSAGHVPLPPYIHTPLLDPGRYQTVFARQPGSAAAPTAGLHFTQELLAELRNQGINFATVTLHVGLDTFAPVDEADPRQHAIHSEWCQVTPEAAAAINQERRAGGRIVAVGTTSVRVLESAARAALPGEVVRPFEGPTSLFILPGYVFCAVDALITNFHLPRSTLIMLVSAFAGRETILSAYEVAKQERYRFYSFGDAMIIL
ncbi:MAG: tRNA preQ1(34) S-adenosylmethionine ribosyltransferase-isomerase QueA [Chloroflexi bacterium RBG_16_58_14]|nr:MAG: tRNA preQ1(34) S-adenosylmethionine ribosyltransferase-isomerase QueA [Chloroflexi bacterium RBG_16_58_14]